jgi:thioredoxin 1
MDRKVIDSNQPGERASIKASVLPKAQSATRAWIVAALLGSGVPLFAQDAKAEDFCHGNSDCLEEMLDPQGKAEMADAEKGLMEKAKNDLEEHIKNFTFIDALKRREKLVVLDLIKMSVEKPTEFSYTKIRDGFVSIAKRRGGDQSIPSDFKLVLRYGNLITARGTISGSHIDVDLNPQEWIEFSKLEGVAETIRKNRTPNQKKVEAEPLPHGRTPNKKEDYVRPPAEKIDYPTATKALEDMFLAGYAKTALGQDKKEEVFGEKKKDKLLANLLPGPLLDKVGKNAKPEEVLNSQIENFKILLKNRFPGGEDKKASLLLVAGIGRMCRKKVGDGKLDQKKWGILKTLTVQDLLAEFTGDGAMETNLRNLIRNFAGMETEADEKAKAKADAETKKEAEKKAKEDTKPKAEGQPEGEDGKNEQKNDAGVLGGDAGNPEKGTNPDAGIPPKDDKGAKLAEKPDVAPAPWLSLDWLKAELVNEKRPVLMEIGATWCNPCKQLAPELKKVEDKMGDKIRILRVDIDQHKDIQRSMGKSKGIPRLVLFVEGKVIDSDVGQRDASGLMERLKNYVK